DLTDNKDYLRNVAEWLTAATAKVLVYLDFSFGSSYYVAPLALALNDLGVKYYLTTPSYSWGNYEQFNMSLPTQEWDLVIVNNPSFSGIDVIFDELLDYLDTDGHLILSIYDADAYAPHPLFFKMGFNVTQDVMDQPPMYIWDAGHDIFTQPIAYGEDRFEAISVAADDGDRLEVYSNATALAGYTASETAGEAFIVLRNDEQTLYNGYLIDVFNEDLDDSCYRDNFELWKNEIAFMLRPKLEFTPNVPDKIKAGDTITIAMNITNYGLSTAPLGLIEISIPTELGITSDPIEYQFVAYKGDTNSIPWVTDITGIGTYTISFDAIYQGFLGTVYGSYLITLEVTTNINWLASPHLWYLIGGGVGLLALIIIITIVSIVIKKKKTPTR
ncbi:MAG: GGIII-like transmembrane region-containing protein, partial [Candidatus Heimdallarchaeota archaeon]